MKFVALLIPFAILLSMVKGQLVPAMFIFGDSIVDVGNNNDLVTLVKANFPPYGRDFAHHEPTGRFCNGKLAIDIIAEGLGFTDHQPAYMSDKANGEMLLIGVNFASAASGYYNATAILYNLYELGARRIGVTTLPPLGCLPAAITAFGHGSNQCVARLNNNAISFNNKLNHRSQRLKRRFSKLKLVVLDIYSALYTIITKPDENGFAEVRRACCGTGLLETSILCNQHSIGTCSNASQYVFWDSFHPTEAANKILATNLSNSGSSLIQP
ncbi:GDSL esterase/lipase At5g22810 isoform X1 [Gossypium hirsutum]|uniref:GDSL esterase/lipase At5g22810 isoform X1 n=1 Tax=Gossypium hirsutum TaxID=3635 RepID=A0ABM2YKN2_GOSHI|nr:GDSL esterase/lipase At5g22810-like isoform X1 [Gossypium hirsutum]